MSDWYSTAKPGNQCTNDTRCEYCKPDGDCEACDTIDGRWMDAVSEYASTCDRCGDLTSNELFAFVDPVTHLGYCEACAAEVNTTKELPNDPN